MLFGYNVSMALISFIISGDTADFIETWLPFKGTVTSALGLVAINRMDPSYFNFYECLIDSAVVAYAIFEMTQVCHFSFKLSRFLKERIDFQQGVC